MLVSSITHGHGQQGVLIVHRMGLPRRGLQTIPLPRCRTIRHNSPMTPLLSGSMESTTFCDSIAALRSRTSGTRGDDHRYDYKRQRDQFIAFQALANANGGE